MLTVLGIGTLAWLSDVPTDQLTLAQTRLIDIADWLVKASVGAILGFAGGAGLASGKNAGYGSATACGATSSTLGIAGSG